MPRHFIAECERENLHLSGHIQPHGALLVVNNQYIITHRSSNIARFLPSADCEPGQRLPTWLAEPCDNLGDTPGTRLQLPWELSGPHGALDLVITRSQAGDLLLELTPATSGASNTVLPCAVGNPAGATNLQALEESQQALVELIARATGHGRVMYYRFLEEGDGEVIAEAHDPAVFGSYLGLRFPASDIPQIARELYLQNPWRLIPDTDAIAVPIEGITPPPDLSRSDLRSVSPVHLVYLANMGVRASLSFPVIVAGQLHGLIACHHQTPLHPPLEVLTRIAQEVRSHSLALTAFIAQNRMQLIDGLIRRFTPVTTAVKEAGNLMNAWTSLGPLLTQEFSADGAHVLLGDQHASWAIGFEAGILAAVDQWFVSMTHHPIHQSDKLSLTMPTLPMSRVAGMLAIKGRCRNGQTLRVYLTRQEHIHEVAWGGNPDKPIEFHDGTHGISPRRSFEKWLEKRFGYSRPWDNESRLLGLRLREILLDVADLH